MKKVGLCIFICGSLLSGFADECKHFWFSQSQQNAQFVREEPTKKIVNYGRLKDNKIVKYTSVSNDDFSSNTSFNDSVYQGCGFFERTGIVDIDIEQYHTTKPSQEKYQKFLERNIEILNKDLEK